ncbi:MAG TPA: phosphodiester glycosidase family protein [Flavisolibacter sp.]|nr:phosphodiester glycosidase family protein [Flavisolibacter sp.]
MTKYLFCFLLLPFITPAQSKLSWQHVDSFYAPLPKSVEVYYTDQPIDSAPFKAFYLIADLKDKKLEFNTDTTYKRRLTPQQFYEKNEMPLLVVNGTFFSFETNQNLNVVIKEGKAISYNTEIIRQKVGDSIREIKVYRSAIGINKKRKADVAWISNDSSHNYVFASQVPVEQSEGIYWQSRRNGQVVKTMPSDNFYRWKMQTAIGGGPVLVQKGEIKITNNEERMFGGKAINDKHPRTAMGYTADNKLIILVVEGRNSKAGGATLIQEAQILKDLGCVEAINLDGGGSSCMLINGKETISPSDKVQRPVPAVFLIKEKR